MDENKDNTTPPPKWAVWAYLIGLIVFYQGIDKIHKLFVFFIGIDIYTSTYIFPTLVSLLYLTLFFYVIYRIEKYNYAPDERSFLKYLSTEAKTNILPYTALTLVFSIMVGRIFIHSDISSLFNENDQIWWSPYSYTFNKPNRGDIILHDSSSVNLSLVIGIPQDTIKINNDSIFVNKNFLSTIQIQKYSIDTSLILEEGKYLVIDFDKDTKDFSKIRLNISNKNIQGSVFLVSFPLSRIGFVKSKKLFDNYGNSTSRGFDIKPLAQALKIFSIIILIFIFFFTLASIFRVENIIYIIITFGILYVPFYYIKIYENLTLFYKIVWVLVFWYVNLRIFKGLENNHSGFASITIVLSWFFAFIPLLPFLPFIGLYYLYKKLFPSDDEIRKNAESLIRQQNYKPAIKLYKSIKNKVFYDLINLSYCHEKLFHTSEAIKYREDALKIDNTNYDNIVELMEMYGNYKDYSSKKINLLFLKEKKYPLTIDEIREVVQLSEQNHSNDTEFLLKYRLILEELEPDNIENLRSIAKLYDEKDELNFSVDYYKKVESIDGLFLSEVEDVAYFYMQMLDYENAILYFNHYLNYGQKPIIFKYLSDCYKAIGDKNMEYKYYSYFFLSESDLYNFKKYINKIKKSIEYEIFIGDFDTYKFSEFISIDDFTRIVKS